MSTTVNPFRVGVLPCFALAPAEVWSSKPKTPRSVAPNRSATTFEKVSTLSGAVKNPKMPRQTLPRRSTALH